MEVTSIASARALFPAYEQLRVEYDPTSHAVWCFLNSRPRPCMTLHVLQELKDFQTRLRNVILDRSFTAAPPIEYMVGASSDPRFFSLGGDLAYFRRLIVEGDRESLRAYAHDCVEVLYANVTNLDVPLTTIAVLHGDALGGGAEAALSCQVIIAERGVRIGFPEILFNLLPGMGAYTLLKRRIHPATAERMLLSGLNYRADELHQLGLVDVVCSPGEGQQAARDYMHQNKQKLRATRLMSGMRSVSNPVSRKEMIDITNMWVDAAMALTEKELTIMDRLIAHQDGAYYPITKAAKVVALSNEDRTKEQKETV